METIFRFHLLRPPVLPDPRYPAFQLAQDTPFQVELAKAAAAQRNPGPNPAKTMNQVADEYLAGPDFVDADRENAENIKLDTAAAKVSKITLSTDDAGETAAARPALLAGLNDALAQDAIAFAQAESTKALLIRLVDSIVAIRQAHVESPGTMETLALRLRLLDLLRRMAADENFPLSRADLRGWWQRTLLAPTALDLQSILSTATTREEARKKALENLQLQFKGAQSTYNRLLGVKSALGQLRTIPNTQFRRTKVVPRALRAPAADVSRAAFQDRKLQMINTLADMGKMHYEAVLKSNNARFARSSESLRDADNGDETRFAAASEVPGGLLHLPDAAGLNSLVDMSRLLFQEQKEVIADEGAAAFAPPDSRDLVPTLTEDAAKNLPEQTKDFLKGRGLDLSIIPLAQAIRSLEAEEIDHSVALDKLYGDLDDNTTTSVTRAGNTLIHSRNVGLPAWRSAIQAGALVAPNFRQLEILPDPRIPNSKGRVTIAGMCDLLVVKQQLVEYEGADVAHIESVLLGEKKTREVTTRREVESTVYSESETTTEEASEKSSVERFETAEEAAREIKQAEALKAGVTISASYGPMVKMSASAEGSRTRSKEESGKTATKHAQEITEKVTEKIQKRVLERSTLKITTEMIDKATHELGNVGGTRNINGVYQFVTKVYEAQTYNYGKRTMLDFMVPEPGHFLFDGPGTKGQPALETAQLPDVPEFGLAPSEIDETNWRNLAFTLGATDLAPPPLRETTKTFQHTHPTQALGTAMAYSEDIEIPEGYGVTFIAVWMNQKMHRSTFAVGSVVVGDVHADIDVNKTIDYHSACGSFQRGKIAASVACYDFASWSMVVVLTLVRTPEAYGAWQFDCWAKLTARRQALVAQREAKEAQLKADAAAEAYARDPSAFVNPGIRGINPAFNQQIMRDEMKKHCISIMTDQHFEDFNAIKEDSRGNSEIDLYQAAGEGPYVRFFEQAFEWDQMTWTTYPYFWGRKDRWFRRIAYDDPDPAFREFMRSGFARANVPIRPGFEGAVDHYLSTGQVWQGGALPNIRSKLFLPIAAEIEEDLGRKAGVEEKYGEPWLVRVPTSLVTLRLDDKLPMWERQPDGSWVSMDKKGTTPTPTP